jgi:hypothetical protein
MEHHRPPKKQRGFNGFTSDERVGPVPMMMSKSIPDDKKPRCAICKKRLEISDQVFIVFAAASQTGRSYAWHADCDPDLVKETEEKQKAEDKAAVDWLAGPNGFKRGY